MRILVPGVVKVSLLKLKVGRRFRARTRITRRTLAVASAFGLGVDEEQEVVVVPELELEVNPGEIVFVTGESGAGKSVLLRLIASQLARSPGFRPILSIDEVAVDENELVVHGVGRDVGEALELLSHVGLNEAFIFLRRFGELSEGQRYRYLLAKALDRGAKTLILDDFCSPLDGVTARVVAYTLQKLARRRGITILAASTRDDVTRDLNPDLLIRKGWGDEVSVEKLKPAKRPCSLMDEIEVVEGTVSDYRRLARFHYIAGRLPPIRRIFAARRLGETVGVIVYSFPLPNHEARGRVFPWIREIRDRGERLRLINRLFSRIARVVVHPRFRGIGLGARLVRETLHRAGTPIVETLAVMARYNPFFEHAGMRRADVPGIGEAWRRILSRLEELGFNLELASSKRYNLKIIGRMSKREVARLRMVLEELARALRGAKLRYVKPRLDTPEELAETIRRCIPRTGTIYLYWTKDENLLSNQLPQKYLRNQRERDERERG